MPKMGRVGVRMKSVKGKRWKKGQSSSSNPQTNKHRNAAKGKFSGHLAQAHEAGLPLTTDALASHDAIQGERDDEMQPNSELLSNVAVESGEDEDIPSISVSTASTAYSLIETSHVVFNKVKKLWNSNQESHREICAVLAAASEVIKTNGGKESATEYFGVLVTALESAENEKACMAISYLLSLVMPRTPVEVLQAKYGTVCKIISQKLSLYEMSDLTLLLKYLVKCMTSLLGAQVGAIWSESSTQRVFQLLLNYTVHPKPTLRKASRSGVVSMLREGTSSGGHHPAARLTASHCIHIMEKGSTETTVLHVLGMLKDCLANMNTAHLKSLCELILKFISFGNSVVRSTAFKTLHGLFSSVSGPQGLTHQDTMTLISCLYHYQPNLLDAQLLTAWLTVMDSAHNRLAGDICLRLLPQFFSSCVNCFLASKNFVREMAASVMEGFLKKLRSWNIIGSTKKEGVAECGSPGLLQNTEAEYVKCVGGGNQGDVELMFKAVESGLKYKYFSSWKWVLRVLSTFYEVAGQSATCQKFMMNSLVSLCELRGTPDFPLCDQLDTAFGAAIKSMGPRVVLGAVPLMLEVERSHDFPRSWILPVLKTSIEATELSYFRDTLMPLADALGAKGRWYLQGGNGLQAKLYSTLQLQVWSLLPKFCVDPVDLCTALTPDFARVLGMTLKEAGLLFRKIVCQALKQLIGSCHRQDQDQARLSRFAKNFLPILFSLYAPPPSGEAMPLHTDSAGMGKKGFLMECIKTYLSIAGATLVEAQYSKLLEKLRDGLLTAIHPLLLDLAMAFAPHLSETSLASLFSFILPLLDSGQSIVQKKAYGCLEVLLSGTSDAHTRFLEGHLDQLRCLLVESLSTVSAGSKKPRFKCLLTIADHLSPPHSDFIAHVVPEVILCVKGVNEKVRVLALKLLANLGHAAQRCFGKKPQEALLDYLSLVLAGLAGSPHMVSCTLLALSKLVYEFHDLLGTDLIKKLIHSMLAFLSSHNREVVMSTLVLLKVVIGILPADDLAPHVEGMVTGILSWGENKRNHFRLKSRVIVERLVRKFGCDLVGSFVPKKHQKLMLHIRKANVKRKRKKSQPMEGGPSKGSDGRRRLRQPPTPSYKELLESSDDDEEPAPLAPNRNLRNRKRRPVAASEGRGKAWIKEGAEGDPVNFMEATVVKSVIATNPNKLKREGKGRPHPFVTDKEGKLVIMDDGKSADSAPAPSGAQMDAMEVDKLPSRKRSRGSGDNEEGSDGEGSDRKQRGVASGSGIYRADARKQDFKAYGAEYKAKKAKGDVKKKGQPDPYAYIPLNRQKLNRRKKAKMQGEFSGLMKKAVKGSVAGAKLRHRTR